MTNFLRYIPICLFLGFSLSSCSDNEKTPSLYDSPETYITFAIPTFDMNASVGDFANSGLNTRSTLATSVEKFKVWGYCVPENISSQTQGSEEKAALKWDDKSIFFTKGTDLANINGNDVSLTSSGFTTYNAGTLTPWITSKDALHTFIAAADPNDVAIFTMSRSDANSANSHGPILTVTLPTTGSIENQPDVMIAATFDHEKKDGRVPVKFNHIMTGIRFKFNNDSELPLYVSEVTYSGNFYYEASFDFTTTKAGDLVNAQYGDWMKITKNDESNSPKTVYRTFNLLTTQQVIPVSGSIYMGGNENPTTLLLLPNPEGTTDNQDGKFALGTDKEITIKYKLGENGEEKTFTLGDNFTLNYIPQPNTLHTAYFNFVGDRFIVAFQADNILNWENGNQGGSSNITIK